MGVETELLGLKNRYDGKEFRVIEREDGTIAVLAGDTVVVDSGVTPVTAAPSGSGIKILWSGVVGATYGVAAGVATVAATAHGLPSSSLYSGAEIFWPGSADIPAGWYAGYTYVDTNSFRFSAPVTSVAAGTAVSSLASAAWTTETALLSSNSERGDTSIQVVRDGDTTSGNKILKLYCGSTGMCTSTQTTAPRRSEVLSYAQVGASQVGFAVPDNISTTSAPVVGSEAEGATASLRGSLANASQWLAVLSAKWIKK